MTPQELAAAAKAGDHDAFAQLWAMYRREVLKIAFAQTRNHHVAEDIASETFLRAWKYIHNFTWQRSGFGGWLNTIVRNLIRDHYRSNHYQRTWAVGLDDNAFWEEDLDRRSNPITAAAHAELAAALDAAIATLTPGQRDVILRRFGADESIADTAAALGLKPGAVKSAQHKAAAKLRRHPAIAALGVIA